MEMNDIDLRRRALTHLGCSPCEGGMINGLNLILRKGGDRNE
jgi:hypothetical protein